MRRPVIVGGVPYLHDYYRKNAKTLFEETGGNTGNLAFRYAVASHIVEPRFCNWETPAGQIRATGDVIVLPLANQLGGHTDLANLSAWLSEINLPIVAVGLGAQAAACDQDVRLTAGTESWVRTIGRLSPSDNPNIGVRGAYTSAQMAKLGLPDSVVVGCPSNFINPSADLADLVARRFEQKPQCIAVAAGIPYIPALARIERDLADIVTRTGGAYIVQHDLRMLQLARGEFDLIGPELLETCRNYVMPNKSIAGFKSWCRQYAYAFYDARCWMDFLRRFDFVVGTRFHGAMLAIQAGVPAACITHDSRTEELCTTMCIPFRKHSEIEGTLTQHNILDYFRFDKIKYQNARHELEARYRDLFASAEIQMVRSV